MLEVQFILENAHFAMSLFTALVFFAVAWLYLDAWFARKTFKDGLKIVGFLLICLSFVAHASSIDQSILKDPIFGAGNIVKDILRITGYIALLIGLITDPLQERPHYAEGAVDGGSEHESGKKSFFRFPDLWGKGIKPTKSNIAAAGLAIAIPAEIFSLNFSSIILPVLASGVAFWYLRRATIGLEDHLKPVSYSFFIFSIHELFSLSSLFKNTNSIAVYKLVESFNVIWIVEHLILLAGIIFLGRWVFRYLLKRLQSQLFMIFTFTVLSIFLVTTVAFTSLLLRSIQEDALSHLQTDVNILQYSITSKKAETLSDAQVVAQNPEIEKGVVDNDRKILKTLATSILLAKKQSLLVIVSKTGGVLMRGDDPERIGDSLSEDPLVKKALSGENISSVLTRDGVVAPTVSVRSAAPVRDSEEIVGAVIVGMDIDSAFVDGVKDATKLDAAIYAGNIRSATTFVGPDGKSRWVGIKEENSNIKKAVLADGKPYTGSSTILNTSYLSAFAPLKDMDNVPVGMLFVGREQSSILQAAGRSIELTFIIATVLLVLSIFPAFFVSRYITTQIR